VAQANAINANMLRRWVRASLHPIVPSRPNGDDRNSQALSFVQLPMQETNLS
jgi:hypothetical protein